MCRRRWILSIFPHLLVHQPANKRDISTALYPIGWDCCLAATSLRNLPFPSLFPLLFSLEGPRGSDGMCWLLQPHLPAAQGTGGLWKDPSTHCRLLHHQFQLLCLFSWGFFTSAVHGIQNTFLPSPSSVRRCAWGHHQQHWEWVRTMIYPAGIREQDTATIYPARINQHSPTNTSAFSIFSLSRLRLHPLKTGKERIPRAKSTLADAGCEREEGHKEKVCWSKEKEQQLPSPPFWKRNTLRDGKPQQSTASLPPTLISSGVNTP